VAVATDVADAIALDRVLWMPAGEPPHKARPSVTPAATRLAMVVEAAAVDRRFEVSTLEIERPGPSYTVDTVRSLRGAYPADEIFLIVGADQISAFGTWRAPDEIARLARLAVMDRAGESAAAAARDLPAPERAVVVPVRRIDISSTDVRAHVRDGLDISGLVPPGVRAIIERERLYSGS
jgi:nicotinate-nucleotide adenylyltransferase